MTNIEILSQIEKLINQSQNILIISHTSIDGDGIGSGLGLHMALTKLGKNVTFYSRHPVPEVFKFLPGINNISTEFNLNQDFIIQIDTSQTKIDTVKTHEEGNNFRIIVTPKNGVLNKDDFQLLSGGKKMDLIFTLDTSTLEYTGLMNGPQAELFYETPVINIDHHVTNEQYGKVNYVDIAATSTAELVLNVIEKLAEKTPLMDEDMATCLLSGVIVDTGSFQNANTTPRAFAVAARLLTAGARQQEIIRHLFKMHELSTLRLWGRALAHLEHDPELHLAWTTVTQDDFKATNADESELDGLMDQLITSASDADIVFLIKEGTDGTKVSLRSLKNIDVTPIVLPFGGGGHQRAAGFKISDKTVLEAEEIAITAVKDFMRKYLDKSNQQPAIDFHPVQSTKKDTTQPALPTPPIGTSIPTETETHVPQANPIHTNQELPPVPSTTPAIQTPPTAAGAPTFTPTVNYIPEVVPPQTAATSTDVSYSQTIPLSGTSPLPTGNSQAQAKASEQAYSEPQTALPYLGYTPPEKPEEKGLLRENAILTPEEQKAAEMQQQTNPITLRVSKDQ